jgi:CelD/BcsL family acetyltransferase involved in cellulose biosynthesis
MGRYSCGQETIKKMNNINFTIEKSFSVISSTDWNDLLSESITDTPFLRYEYLGTWWDTFGGGEWQQAQLAIVLAHKNGTLIGIAPLFVATHNGIQTLLLLGSLEVSDYLDVIVRQDDLLCFISGLLDFLSSSSMITTFSRLSWYNLPDTSPTLTVLEAEATKRKMDFKKEIFRPSLYVPLPGDFELYLSSINKKQRHEIRRKTRRLENSMKTVRWYIVKNSSETLDSEIDEFLSLMAKDHDKNVFLSKKMLSQMRRTMTASSQAGWLHLSFLEIDGQKAAGYLSFDYGNSLLVYNSGLNPDYREFSPGWVLLGYMLKWANDNGRTEFDFMRGDESYKYKFGAKKRNVMKVCVEI